MTTSNRSTRIDGILERLAIVLECNKDIELAKALCVAPTTLSTWRMRESIPYQKIENVALNKNVSLDWLLLGRGEVRSGGNYEKSSLSPELHINVRAEITKNGTTVHEWLINQ